MESSITETVWFSEKRRKILLLLLEGPKNPDELKKAFGTAWRALILPLKELKEDELVCNPAGAYELTNIGKLIAESVKPLDGILNLFGNDTDYWVKRDLNAIPEHLLDRLGEMEDCTIAEPGLNDMFEPSVDFTTALLGSQHVHSVFSIYHPFYPPLYIELAESGKQISIVLTGAVLERMHQDKQEELARMQSSKNIELFLYTKEPLPPSIIVTDRLFSGSFFNNRGRYDHRDILSLSQSSINWGEELFIHYRKMADSIPTEKSESIQQ